MFPTLILDEDISIPFIYLNSYYDKFLSLEILKNTIFSVTV
jgi:hypothetical protein